MARDESKRWSDVHGGPVAWIPPTSDIVSHPLWDFIPNNLAEYRAIFGAHSDSMTESCSYHTTSELRMRLERRELSAHQRRYALPATGVVEHVSRVYQAHPFDVVSALLQCIAGSIPAVAEVGMSHLCTEVTRDALRHLGHSWWSVPTDMQRAQVASLNQDDLFLLVRRCAEGQSHQALVGPCIKTWVKRVLIPWQRKKFFGAAPMQFSNTAQGELLCAHV
jgi:hypothetical protein